jgi:hypothetical protein
MKFKLLIIIMLLLCCPLISQELYQGLRVVTWEEVQGTDYIILSDDGEVVTLEVNGETVVIEKH